MKELKIGILGMSEGNGHPYSWAAIFNGYDEEFMRDCPFSVIHDYLSKQKFPEDAIPNAKVSHIWTQDATISKHIAKAARIENVVDNYVDMIGKVDAVLLARDDPENHYEMSAPFIAAGLPIFIDKPLSLEVVIGKAIFSSQKFPSQVFTCSSLRFASELHLTVEQLSNLGDIKMIDAIIPKSWEKYAVHIIEPTLQLIPNRGGLISVENTGRGDLNIVSVKWANDILGVFKVTGNVVSPLEIRVFGTKGFEVLTLKDTFNAFKGSLLAFVKSINQKQSLIPESETLEIIEIIEKGRVKNE